MPESIWPFQSGLPGDIEQAEAKTTKSLMKMSTSPSFTTYICSPLSPCSKILVPAAKDIAFEVSAKMLPSLTIGGG